MAGLLGTMIMGAGTILSGVAAVKQGNTARAVSNYEAQQLDAQANDEMAAGTREAANESTKTALLLSRARAVGAASGGGMDFEMLGDIGGEGGYRSLTAMWGGVEAALGRRAQAGAVRFEGRQQQAAGRVRGFNTVLQGAGTIYDAVAVPPAPRNGTLLSQGTSLYERYG